MELPKDRSEGYDIVRSRGCGQRSSLTPSLRETGTDFANQLAELTRFVIDVRRPPRFNDEDDWSYSECWGGGSEY